MLAKKGSLNTITSPKHSCLPEMIKFLSLDGTVLTIVLLTQIHFSKVISQHVTEQVMWKVSAWGQHFNYLSKL